MDNTDGFAQGSGSIPVSTGSPQAMPGVHLLLQVRCAALNGELLERFQRWMEAGRPALIEGVPLRSVKLDKVYRALGVGLRRIEVDWRHRENAFAVARRLDFRQAPCIVNAYWHRLD
jgi:hypothetical protein